MDVIFSKYESQKFEPYIFVGFSLDKNSAADPASCNFFGVFSGHKNLAANLAIGYGANHYQHTSFTGVTAGSSEISGIRTKFLVNFRTF